IPLALFAIAAILAFHRGRPVVLRVTATALIPALIGALAHLFFGAVDPNLGYTQIGSLWYSGLAIESGGVISGLLADVLENMVSAVGAAIVLILLLGFCLLLISNKSIAEIADWFKNRESVPYEPVPERERVYDNPTAPFQPETRQNPSRQWPGTIDIPMDGEAPPAPRGRAAKQKGGRNAIKLPQSNVQPPDKFLNDETPVAPPLRKRASFDIPLDGEGQLPYVDDSPSVPNLTAYQRRTSPPAPQLVTPAAPAVPEPGDKIKPGEAAAAKAEITEEIEKHTATMPQEDYKFPPVSLLSQKRAGAVDASQEITENAERLAATLDSFEIEAGIVNATRGPSVTRYELELEPGVKLSKLTNLANDLALSLGASGVRIAPIPNKIATVGVEVPNQTVSTVFLREMIESDNFQEAKGKLAFALGKDISGNCIVGNVAKLPHLLIAGTTGSGKSVTVNSLILSILFRARPDEVKLIMIDPKMVEFGKYNGVPHLLIPVVTDPKKAAGALQWAVTEMLKRYKVFSELGAKDLESYNRTAEEQEDLQKFPQLVVVIDELADLMMTAAKEVEESICRVAQMGRAAGVHLVVSTQRPSANVITGLMKANIPSRIALSVSSAMESRIIMDDMGAEKLVGNGDMLYKPIGEKPTRIQGAYVDEQEIEQVIEFLKQDTEPEYDDTVGNFIEDISRDEKANPAPKGDGPLDDYDEMFGDAVNMVLDLGQASTSVLQRKLKLGYSRAGRLMDQLEEAGIVGPHMGSKPRQVLISRAEWQAMQAGGEVPETPESEFADIPKDDFSDLREEPAEVESYD
ncbi:MAG: DNA translocase FtsK, partial [Oscillospiraceae bacterium]|nr:DNA translocase FtsK [Oscillospiraceae bacterium]